MNLTADQLQAIVSGETVTVTVAGTKCVVLREDVFRNDVDDSPWTEAEMNFLADEANDMISRAEADVD